MSSLELTHDTNGEQKSMIAEKKSTVDTAITTAGTTTKEIIGAFRGQTETEKLEEKAKMLELLKKIKDLETAEDQIIRIDYREAASDSNGFFLL